MEWLGESWSWIRDRETLLAWVGSLSLATIVLSAFAAPVIIRRMPHDYFLDTSPRAETIRKRHPILRILFLVLKNLVGGILAIGGILMLLTPGQGVLTIVIGLMLMDFPGKRRLEIALMRFGPLHRGIQWMRKRAGKRPLELPEPHSAPTS